MARLLSLLALALLASSALVNAQDECAAAVTQATTPLKTDIEAFRDQVALLEKQASQQAAGCAVEKAAMQQSAGIAQKQAESLMSQMKSMKTELKTALAALSAKEQELAAAMKAANIDFGSAITALAKSAAAGVEAAVAEGKAIAAELSTGKSDRLLAVGFTIAEAFHGAATSTAAFIGAVLPEPVKKPVLQAYATVAAALKEHVLDAEWAKPVLAGLYKTNDEVKDFLIAQMKKRPALAPHVDPVTVQLIAGAIFTVPLVLLLVAYLVLATGTSKAPASPAAGAKGAKKGGPKKRQA